MDYLNLEGAEVRRIRQQKGMTLVQFWTPMHIKKQQGGNWELGRHPMSAKVKQLVWLHHIATAPQALEALGKTNSSEG